MECETCGWPYGPCQEKNRKASFLHVYLGEGFLQSLTIPCFMREHLNNILGKIMIALSPEKDEYVFHVKKKYDKTIIYGPEYEMMLKDFDMKSGESIRFEWDDGIDEFFIFTPLGHGGVVKDRVLEDHVFKDSAKSIVFSKGITLTAGQTGRMNHHVLTRGLGLGHVFVHSITETDVKNNGLRIPKAIASALDIPETGKLDLSYAYGGIIHEAKYYTCKDKRICLREGWPQLLPSTT